MAIPNLPMWEATAEQAVQEEAGKALTREAPARQTPEAGEVDRDVPRTTLPHVRQEPGERADRGLSWSV